MSDRLWQHRINDIIAAIEKIQKYVEGMDFHTFQQDSKTSDAVIRNFIIIGEAAPVCLRRSQNNIRPFRGV